MGQRVSLDSGAVIAIERRRLPRGEVLSPGDDVAMSMIAVAEFRAGERNAEPGYRPRMQRFLDQFFADIELLPYNDAVLEEHVKLLAWTHRHGCPRGQHDLIIAATCLATDRVLLTVDRRARFEDLPGLRVRLLG